MGSGISQYRLQQLASMIQQGQEHGFYAWPEWQEKREEVLQMDCRECQRCKQLRRRHRAAVIVHHVKHLRDRPDLALSVWDGEERQLISVCKQCHEELHPEAMRQNEPKAPPLTPERWD